MFEFNTLNLSAFVFRLDWMNDNIYKLCIGYFDVKDTDICQREKKRFYFKLCSYG